ncbi:hypothetical protein ACIQU3_16665 [Streptomyces sp. NPDC101110]|uniref:hypothetical protein n=1 Tax=Streptomyces sp. NPDC101110 TaxID=3366104 RepID=UPI0037FB41C7
MPSLYKNTKRYYGCRFGQAQLRNLAAMVGEDMAPGSVSFRTNFGTYHFQADTLAALVAEVEASPDVGTNKPWDNLTITAQGPAPGSECSITIDPDRTAVEVKTDTHNTWARGLEARIGELLTDQAAGRHDQTRSPAAKRLRSSLAGVGLWAFVLWYSVTVYPTAQEEVVLANGKHALTQAGGQLPTSSLVVLGALLLWCIGNAVRHFVGVRATRPTLVVASDLPSGPAWQRLSFADKVATVAAVLTGLAMVGTVVSAAADVFKP